MSSLKSRYIIIGLEGIPQALGKVGGKEIAHEADVVSVTVHESDAGQEIEIETDVVRGIVVVSDIVYE